MHVFASGGKVSVLYSPISIGIPYTPGASAQLRHRTLSIATVRITCLLKDEDY